MSAREQAEIVANIARELRLVGMAPTGILVRRSGDATILMPLQSQQDAAATLARPSEASSASQPLPPLRAAASETIQALNHALAVEGEVVAVNHDTHPTTTAAASATTVAKPRAAPRPATYDVFVSHCKRTDASEDRAIWVSDVMEASGLRVFFDRTELTEISVDRLKSEVQASRVIVTILDPYTFDSEWVRLENEWAYEAGRPIVGLYDGDRFRWEAIAKWRDDFPHVFRRPVVNYQKDYRIESKSKLLAAVRGAATAAESAQAETRAAIPAHLPSSNHGRGGGGACEPSSSDATAAAPAAPLPTPAPASLVRIAIGKSTLAGAADAARTAWRHLVSKLSNAVPHFVIASYCGEYDPTELANALSACAAKGCRILGASGGFGMMVEDAWVGYKTYPQMLLLWGISDPLGAYEVAYTGRADAHGMKDATKRAIEPQITRGLPRFTVCYTTPTFEASTVKGIQDVIDENALIFGLAVSGPKGFEQDANNLPNLFALTAGEPFDPATQMGAGGVAAFCWPSVFIAGAFCPGGGPDPHVKTPREGVVTKVGVAPPTFLKRYTEEYIAICKAAARDAPICDVTIEEIDGRPATEVFHEWLSPAERERLMAISGGNKETTDFSDIDWVTDPSSSLFITTLIIGVIVGYDGDGKAVHKQLTPCAFLDGAIVLFGCEVCEGDRIERLAVPTDPNESREQVSWTARHVMTEAGFDFDSVQGALMVGCGMFWICGGFDDGLQQLSHKMGEALNWAPTLGMFGGPELGPMGRARSDWAVFTVGCVVFSSKPAKAQRLLLSERQAGSAKSVSSVFVG